MHQLDVGVCLDEGIIAPVQFQRRGESTPRCTEAVLEARIDPTPYYDNFYYFLLYFVTHLCVTYIGENYGFNK